MSVRLVVSRQLVAMALIALMGVICLAAVPVKLAGADTGWTATPVSDVNVVTVAGDIEYTTVEQEGFSYQIPATWVAQDIPSGAYTIKFYDPEHGTLSVVVLDDVFVGSSRTLFAEQYLIGMGDVKLDVSHAGKFVYSADGVTYLAYRYEGTTDWGTDAITMVTFAFCDAGTAIMTAGWTISDFDDLANPYLRASATLGRASADGTAQAVEPPTVSIGTSDLVGYEEAPVEEGFDTTGYARVDYANLANSPEQYEGRAIAESGRVAQSVDSDGVTILLVVTSEERGDVVIAAFGPEVFDKPVLVGDTVYCYGTYMGLFTYGNESGQTATVPYMFCDHVELG